MMARVELHKEQIASFCRERHIRRLAIFGSALRPDFRPDSDMTCWSSLNRIIYPALFSLAS